MGIQMTGIDHTMAEIDVREVFAFTKKNMAEALERLKQIRGIEGCVLLSTCNRTELWVSTGEEFQGALYEYLCQFRGVSAELYRDYFVFREEREAVTHLFQLAGGLTSRILGEDQIVTQVGDALAFAREHYAADRVLETLFRQAVTAAKRVKTKVRLTAADHSVISTAIETLQRHGAEFAGKRCMVIGNGIMGKLSATMLQQKGADVTVTVRQYHSGMVEIPEHCSRIDYGRRMELFDRCDYVVSATVSPNYTLTRELVERAVTHPVTLIDLAVPRDIDPLVRELPGVTLYDIDSFCEGAGGETQKQAVSDAKRLLEEQLEEFYVWYECRDLIGRIGTIREQAARDLQLRMRKKLQHLPLDEVERETFRAEMQIAAEKMVNKMLFGLRDGVSRHEFQDCLGALETMYGERKDRE